MNEPLAASPDVVEPPVVTAANPTEARVEVAAVSEKGPRDENQDWLSWVQSPRGELFIVADGMGGYKGGAHAAKLTVDCIEKYIGEASASWPFARALEHAVTLANREVHQIAHSGDPETENMGSTVVVALVADGKVQVGHVGDSRAYLFRDGRLRLLTRDHTQVQQMVEARMITARQARSHPEGHVLTRAIGSRPDVDMEIGRPIRLKEGDSLLMCSDGLSGFVDDKAIRAILRKQPDVQRVPGELVAKALACGGSDNVTIQFVRFGPAVRERWTARLPPPRRETPPTVVTGTPAALGWRPVAAAAALVVAATVALLPYALADPRIELSYEPDPGGEERAVVLRWSAPGASRVRIVPSIGLAVVPTVGTARIPVPVDAPVTYTATATATVMWRTFASEGAVTIPPLPARETERGAAAEPARSSAADSAPQRVEGSPDASGGEAEREPLVPEPDGNESLPPVQPEAQGRDGGA